MEYEEMDTLCDEKNKANSKPNKANSNPILAQKVLRRTQNKPNSKPIYRGVACGEAGTCRGVAYGEDGFQKGYLLVKCMIDNCLPESLFPLTSCPAGDYNGTFSNIIFGENTN